MIQSMIIFHGDDDDDDDDDDGGGDGGGGGDNDDLTCLKNIIMMAFINVLNVIVYIYNMLVLEISIWGMGVISTADK